MTTARLSLSRKDLTVPFLLMGAGSLVALAGTVLGPKFATIAVALPAAAAAIPYAIRRPLVMLTAMIVIEATNVSGVLTPESSMLPRVSLGLGLLTAGIALRDPLLRSRLNYRGTLLGIGLAMCYLVTQVLAAVGSQVMDVSMTSLRYSVADCLYFVVVLVLVQITGKPWAVAAAFVIPLAVMSVLTLVNQVGFGGSASFGGFAAVTPALAEQITTLRYGGPLADSNFWGRHLVMGVPLAGALLVRAVSSGPRRVVLGWAAVMSALLAGIYLTQSRGTIISTAVVFFVWVVASGPTARHRGLMSLPFVVLILLAPGIGNRLISMVADVSSRGMDRKVDPSIIDRMAAQQIAWAMSRDRPVFGFGPQTFKLVGIPQYGDRVRTAVLHGRDGPGAPHNLYAQLAGETGIVGLLGWAIFVGGLCIYLSIRVARLSAVRAAASERSLAAAVLAALVGWSVASIFLHLAFLRTFLIVLALGGALACSAVPDANHRVIWLWRRAVAVVLSGAFGLAISAVILAASATQTHTASRRLTILPTQQMRLSYPYAFDIRTREVLLPTLAAISAANNPKVTAIADTVRGVIMISVTDVQAEAAVAGLDEAVVGARKQLAAFGIVSSFRFADVGGIQQKTGAQRSIVWTTVGLLAGVLAAAATATASAARSRQSHAATDRFGSSSRG